ncbi:hypothetical protein [Arcicella rosea]|uniref:Outer membrane protein beta-barrel domain-containing protein n=1 Tax=Arcicella rosea TaxID=502909 RepID=A0A841EP57_9BACT|nr:hypothetical protein [Arcicella rosea]MBB6002813.1 hypothetical protein [Arcicella rosea]
MKNITLILLLCLFTSNSFSQDFLAPKDTVAYQKGGILYKGVHYSKIEDMQRILLTTPNQEISQLFSSYQSSLSTAKVFSFIGGFAVGWPIGGAIAGRKFDTGLFAGGIGVSLIGLLINGGANAKLKQAVSTFNKNTDNGKISFRPVFYQNEYQQLSAGLTIGF